MNGPTPSVTRLKRGRTKVGAATVLVALTWIWPAMADDAPVTRPLPMALDRHVDFLKDVYPLLTSHCFACHQGEDAESEVRLDYRAALVDADEGPPLVVPGRSDASRLIQVVAGTASDGVRMPPEGEGEPLESNQVALLRAWIDQGVAWDHDKLPAPGVEHWSFRPVVRPQVPNLPGGDWARTPIDAFILARLRQNGLVTAPDADRATLLRRVTFALTGLPPTPEEVVDFTRRSSAGDYERVVDRLLDSTQFGEHFARMWLDVVRFAETEGFEYDRQVPGMWRYRDYVITSLNRDKPYDDFIREQIAGDQLKPEDPEYLVAAGFHRLGPVRRNAGNQDVASSRNEVLTERTNIIGSALLGLSIGCARCHNHRFDPLGQKDYYCLQAFLASTYEYNIPIGSASEIAAWTAKSEKVQAEIDRLKEVLLAASAQEEDGIRAQIKSLERQLPPPLATICTITDTPDKRTPIHVLRRGVWEQPGERVGMRMPRVFALGDAPELPADTSQPRTLLAEQIVDPRHPLTARVMVNRIWAFLVGQGIVTTCNDLGRNGDRPSHPELLDYLAHEFVQGGWHTKAIVRQIVLSRFFCQATSNPQAPLALAKDPTNRLLWRFNRRRLAAEELRDAMLMVSGRLNPAMGGPAVMVEVERDLVELLYDPAQWQVTERAEEHDRRSIYLLAKRNLRLPFMEVFDQPDLQTSCPRRESSTHALQALELLNGRLSNQLAGAFATRLKSEVGEEATALVDRAFWLALGRAPTDAERTSAERFAETRPLEELALAMFNLNAFMYVD